jgi:predicted transcriptional regulator
MPKLLEEAIARARQLPAEDQDVVALAMLAMADTSPFVEIDDETRAAIREGLEQAAAGNSLRTPKSKRSGNDTVCGSPVHTACAQTAQDSLPAGSF